MKLKAPRGTNDFFPPRGDVLERIEEVCARIFRLYGFRNIRTPIFEHTELFSRHIGDTTDIVTKEMYTFLDRSERSLTLRPEGTAAVVRAVVEHNLLNQGFDRFYYMGPMFRYERPAAGRYRQHHQVGVEAFGDPRPEVDVEVIDCMLRCLEELGLEELKVKVNTVGSPESRAAYGEALREYLEPRRLELPVICQDRLDRNPMRLLDEKDPAIRDMLRDAPSFKAFLSAEDRDHHDAVLDGLRILGRSILEDPFLVRGLDYYNRTAFEVVTEALGAQDAVGGGGRYDLLVKDVGGPDTPGVGFAMGVERLMLLLEAQDKAPPARRDPPLVYIVCLDAESRTDALVLAASLRAATFPVRVGFQGGKPLKQFQRAEKLGCRYALILGEQERQGKVVGLRDLASREQREVPEQQVVPQLLAEVTAAS